MTETYHGDWDQVTGDKTAKEVQDPYHPKYPDVGTYRPSKAWGFLEKPAVDANSLWQLPRKEGEI